MTLEGRWWVFNRGARMRWHFAYDDKPGPEWRECVPVVPCDNEAVERIWPEIAKRHEFSGDYAYEIVCDVLRLAGETK